MLPKINNFQILKIEEFLDFSPYGRTGKENIVAYQERTFCLCLLSTVFTAVPPFALPQDADPALLDLCWAGAAWALPVRTGD
jgi:hypothetical protein